LAAGAFAGLASATFFAADAGAFLATAFLAAGISAIGVSTTADAGASVALASELEDTATPFGMSVEEIILAHFQFRNIPIAFGFPAGHLNDNRALILGKKVRFNVEGTTSELRFL
jgi:hypothetical protein